MILTVNSRAYHIQLNEDMEILADIIGDDDKLHEILATFGGSNLYIPQTLDREVKYANIRYEYSRYIESGVSTGEALRLLSFSYNLSVRRIRGIVCGK